MKYIILVLALLGLTLLSSAAAESYSCRDSNDRLHIADNLMSLPEECRAQAVTSEPTDSGKVNYVPPAVQSHQGSNDFKRAVGQEEQKVKQRKREAEELIQRAKKMADSYETAVTKRKAALRSKKYGFRETVILANQEMRSAREGRDALREEMVQMRLTPKQRAQIEALLARIQN
jgi:hypothetical protein